MEKISLEYSVELILTCAEPVIHWLFSIFHTWWRQILLTTAISSGRNKCIVYFGRQHWLCMCKYAKYITHDTSSSSLAYVCFIVFPLEVYLPPECTELTTHMKVSSFSVFFLHSHHIDYTYDTTNYPQFPNSNNASIEYPGILEITSLRDCTNEVGMGGKR